MIKIAICSDIHWSQYSSIVRSRGKKYSTRLENLINSLNWFEHLADEHGCDEIIYLGDTMDRSDINAEELTALQDVKFSSLPHTLLVGNHDASISNLEFSTASVFKLIKASVITEPEVRNMADGIDFYFIPYLTPDKIKPLKHYLLNNDHKKVILTHNDIAGIQYGRFTSQSGFSVSEILENCTLFMDGHLHNSCVINDKIVLAGNLTGQNFTESADKHEHYAYLLTINDDRTITLEPYVNPYAFNFYKLYINKPEDLSVFDTLKNNAVLSISCNNKLIPSIDKKIKNNDKIVEYRVVTIYNNNNNNFDDKVDFKVEDHLQQFIDYVQTKIPPSEILADELFKLSGM